MESVLQSRSKGLSRTLIQRAHGTVMIIVGLSLAIAVTHFALKPKA